MMEAVSIPYFRELLSKHLEEFKALIESWESVSSSENIPEDVRDEIRTTVGLTNLLMRQKMKQFGELIDDSENNRGEKEITCVDLQGFWDMVFHEVEKLKNNFHKLEKCQKNNWVFIEEPTTKVESKKPKEPATVNPKIENAAKERAIAARQRLAEAKLKMKSKVTKKNEDTIEVQISESVKEIKAETNEVKEQLDESEESPRKRSKRAESKSEVQEKVTLTKDSQDDHGSTKSSKKKDKENVLSVAKKNISKSTLSTATEKVSTGSAPRSKKTPKEFTPLQCLTRSAKKALMNKENDYKI